MFLSAYHFEGDAAALVEAYDGMRAAFPSDAFAFQACVVTEGGITVFDGCPSRADFATFSTGPEFRALVAASGLPMPRIDPLGEVHVAVANAAAVGEVRAR